MDDDLKPTIDPDAPPATHEVMQNGSDKSPAPVGTPAPASLPAPVSLEAAKQQVTDSAGSLTQQAGDKALMFADQGKARAVDALEQLSKLIEDAAGQIDERLGGNNGQAVRTAAGTVQGFADQLRDKKVDDLADEARTLISKSPGVAIGIAAAVGFVVSRLVSAGIDQRGA